MRQGTGTRPLFDYYIRSPSKVDLDTRDEDGRTPLSLAVASGHEKTVELLLATGRVDPDADDADGRTLLWWARENGHEAIVKLLLDESSQPRR